MKHIAEILESISMSKGMPAPQIAADTELLGGALAIDSLDLASLVHQLERATGYDPFRSGFVNFRTVGELARLYIK